MIAGKYRFHGHGSLRYVYANGKAQRTQYITLKSVTNPRRKFSRFSVVISKKVLKSAVGRNRVRRRVYEYVRTHLDAFQGIHDVVIICTSSEIRSMPAPELTLYLDQLFEKADILPVTKH